MDWQALHQALSEVAGDDPSYEDVVDRMKSIGYDANEIFEFAMSLNPEEAVGIAVGIELGIRAEKARQLEERVND